MSSIDTIAAYSDHDPDRPDHTAAGPGLRGEDFRGLLAHHPAGVVIVTADIDGEPVGFTATSFTSVSLDPPLVAFYIAEASTTWPELRKADTFAAHLLTEEQEDLATRFATKGIDRFAPPTSWTRGAQNVPLLAGTAVHLVCRRHDSRPIGDHWLVVGEVHEGCTLSGHGPPLVFHRGSFGGFVPSDRRRI